MERKTHFQSVCSFFKLLKVLLTQNVFFSYETVNMICRTFFFFVSSLLLSSAQSTSAPAQKQL